MVKHTSIRLILSTSLCAVLASLGWAKPTNTQSTTLDLRMPGVQPQQDDTYLCHPTKVVEDSLYITGFEPHANMNISHHMLLYGCREPGDDTQQWNCGEMASEESSTDSGPVCKDGAEILYAWAMDAPDLQLPADVAFKVGAATDVKWLVLQVHYKDVHHFTGPDAVKDYSGLTLETTTTPQAKLAGVYLLGTGGEIPAHSTVYMETACAVKTSVVMHPFAYRAHTHSHGEVVSGYTIHDGEWAEIGRVSPQLPQMFYDITDKDITINNEDVIAARCTMKNDEDRSIAVGATQNDEMCNFYVMYWVEGNKLPDSAYCFSDGPPSWSWSDFGAISTADVPTNASVIPGTDVIIEATQHFFDDTEETLREIEEALERKLLELLSGYDDYYNDNNAIYDDNYVNNPIYNMLLNGEFNDYYQEPAYGNSPFDRSYYGDEKYDDESRDFGSQYPPMSRQELLEYYENME